MFVHLHTHTEFSLLDGMCRIPQLVQRTKELGMEALAITDHGALYGIIDFYLACKQAGIKPIIGCEFYLALQSRHNRSPEEKNPYHIILLAKDKKGYSNLLQLSTKAHLDGFFYKPRIDKELLQKHSEGLIGLSSCPHGELGRLILEGKEKEAGKAALWYKEVLEEFYLEIQRHPIPELERINKALCSLSSELHIPVVATNDVHYIYREDAPVHDLLLCIQTNTTIYDEKRMKMPGDFFYLRSPQEMREIFSDLPEAIRNTQVIADKCALELEFGRFQFPKIEIPEGKGADEYLAELSWQGLYQRYPYPPEEYKKRLAYELEVIKLTDFADYFLIIWDIASFARKKNILFGVRGSAAASLVLFCLRVTEIDPLKHNLIFERFLNIERKEMPDIDLDFQDDRREEVISYVTQKYGQDRVAQIITFGTLGARAAIRDVGRALGLPYSQVDRVARLIPFGAGITLERALKENRELNSLYHQDETLRHLIDYAMKLEGIARHASTHAAGIVISKEPLTYYLPLQRPARGSGETPMTQFSMESIAQIGLLKMDFLGLANLTILAKTKELIYKNRGIDIDLQSIPLDDPATFSLLASGETMGVFQLEGVGMRRFLREFKPSSFSDIAALIALYRPGPLEHIPTFIKAKQGLEEVRYLHPSLKEILEETYGVIVYQDQVLLIAQTIADYTLGEADILRKAIGKKIPEVMRNERQTFIDRAKKKGIPEEIAKEIFDLIEPFAGYAFNKAHSVSYALLAYQTAYLKANYPTEYMTSYLNTYLEKQEKVASGIVECHRLGIQVLPPDINKSEADFTIEGDKVIRFGLCAIKNVGETAIKPIISERKVGGRFKSIEDLCRRIDLKEVGKRALESLIKCGALDSLGDRGALLYNLDRLINLSSREARLREMGQASMFDLFGEKVSPPFLSGIDLTPIAIPLKEKLNWEKELLGVYLTDNPLRQVARDLENHITAFCGQIDAEMEGQRVIVAGMITSVRQVLTKDKRTFLSVYLEDLVGGIEVTVFPEVYKATKELWQEGQIVLIEGRVKVKGDVVQLICEKAQAYSPTPSPRRLTITLTQSGEEAKDISLLNQILHLIKEYPGTDEVRLSISTDQGIVTLEWPGLTVRYCPELKQRLSQIIKEEAIRFEGG